MLSITLNEWKNYVSFHENWDSLLVEYNLCVLNGYFHFSIKYIRYTFKYMINYFPIKNKLIFIELLLNETEKMPKWTTESVEFNAVKSANIYFDNWKNICQAVFCTIKFELRICKNSLFLLNNQVCLNDLF